MSDTPFLRIMPLSRIAYDVTEYLKPSPVLRDHFSNLHYKCLPLSAANTLGWTLYNPIPFTVQWLGGDGVDRVQVECEHPEWATSWFGYGTFTVMPGFVAETSPGLNLLIRPVPNHAKIPIMPYDGIVETDWLKASFTINFRILLPLFKVHYAVGEPLVQFVPYPRQLIEDVEPELVTDGADYEARMAALDQASAKRQAWLEAKDRGEQPAHALDYLRGEDVDGTVVADHKRTFRVKPLRRRG